MNKHSSFALPRLLLADALLLASSGGSGETEPGVQESKGEMVDMDMGSGETAAPELSVED